MIYYYLHSLDYVILAFDGSRVLFDRIDGPGEGMNAR